MYNCYVTNENSAIAEFFICKMDKSISRNLNYEAGRDTL
jgi:hypothetical protein